MRSRAAERRGAGGVGAQGAAARAVNRIPAGRVCAAHLQPPTHGGAGERQGGAGSGIEGADPPDLASWPFTPSTEHTFPYLCGAGHAGAHPPVRVQSVLYLPP